jgi:tRNA (cytidine/uridine-2'-O-)-methyltransferase
MFRIVLVTPEIPPNTGNVIRLAANTGCELHLVEPLGFAMEDRLLRRAGLDYHETHAVRRHASWPACSAPRVRSRRAASPSRPRGPSLRPGGLAAGRLAGLRQRERGPARAGARDIRAGQQRALPMRAGQRSLNLSNAVAVAVFEAWRQNAGGFAAAGAGCS